MSIYDVLPEFAEQIWEDGDYDWEWSISAVYYDPASRVYYWYSDAGCSCSSFGDYASSLSDLYAGRLEEAVDFAGGVKHRIPFRVEANRIQREYEESK